MQAVGFIELLRVKCGRPGPFIVVVPLSTIRHWQKEFDERSRANTVVLHGTNEDRDSFVGSEFTGERALQCGSIIYIVLHRSHTTLRARSLRTSLSPPARSNSLHITKYSIPHLNHCSVSHPQSLEGKCGFHTLTS